MADFSEQLYGKKAAAPEPAAPAKRSWLDEVGDAIGSIWNQVSPIAQLQGASEVVRHPVDAVKGIGMAQDELRLRALDAWDKGDLKEAFRNAFHLFIPLMGPGAVKAGDKIHAGKVGEGVGDAIGMGLSMAGPGKLAKSAGRQLRIPGLKNPNAGEAAAAAFVEAEGVPVDAATATGNTFVRGTQKLADASPGGSFIAGKAKRDTAAAMSQLGDRLATKVHKKPTTPAPAGASLRGELEGKTVKFDKDADTSYTKFRDIEQHPANSVEIQVGEEIPADLDRLAQAQAGKPYLKLSPADQQMVQSVASSVGISAAPVPIMKQVAMPVDMRPIKNAIRPLYQEMVDWMEPARQHASAGLKAMKTILEGDDFISASRAEKGLGGLKTLAREGKYAHSGGAAFRGATRDVNQDVGANIVSQLQEAIDTAVARAPEKAGDALGQLKRGRMLTASKYDMADIVRQLREEPVQTFRQMTYAKDSGIDMLHQVQKRAPKEMAKIGRAWLEDLFDKARSQGGWDHADSLWREWQNLGDLTKKVLFKDPRMVADLDKFFLAGKKLAENPNPSGTAVVGWIGTQGAYGLMNPTTGVPWLLGTAGLSKLMHSPKGVALLTQGMTVPAQSVAGASIAAQLLRIAGEDSKKVE